MSERLTRGRPAVMHPASGHPASGHPAAQHPAPKHPGSTPTVSTPAVSTHETALHPAERAAAVLGADATQAGLTRWLRGLPGVDPAGLERHAAALAARAVTGASKARALDRVLSLIDLTTLEGTDTPAKVRDLVAQGLAPDPGDEAAPTVAAVCVYGDMVPYALEALGPRHDGTHRHGLAVASVAAAFPSGRTSLQIKLAQVTEAVTAGADEIDMVIDRGAFLGGHYGRVFDEIAAIREACERGDGGRARLKVILETGELATYDNVRRAAWLAILAGADFIKTSTGKTAPAATLPVTVCMLEAVRDWHRLTGERIGVKPAGGIRRAGDAIGYLVAAAEVAGEEWLTPDLFRIGASSLLTDVVRRRHAALAGGTAQPPAPAPRPAARH